MKELRTAPTPAFPGLRLGVIGIALAAWVAAIGLPVQAGATDRIGAVPAAAAASDLDLAQARPAQGAAQTADDDMNDPLEPLNRAIFAFNEAFYDLLLGPLSQLYEFALPPLVREGIRNILFNLNTPVVLANDILQGEAQRALETLGRAVVNTTIGMGGVIDIGAELGVKRHNEDFGQTLGVWGVGELFYLVVPVLGPSNPRDAVGKLLVDGYFDPLGLWFNNTDRDVEKWTRVGVKGVDEYSTVRDDLAQIKKTSIDYYAAIRSLYRQKREAEISNGRDLKLPPIPDLGYAPPDAPAPEAAAASLAPAEKPSGVENSDQVSFRLVHPDLVRD